MISKFILNFLIILSLLLLLILIILVFINYIIGKKYLLKEFFEDSYANEDEDYIEPEIIENLINEEEINYIINKSKEKFDDSTVIAKKDEAIQKNIRDSKTAWLSKNDSVIKSIIEKVCRITNKKIENCEDLQVVKYDNNGYYRDHHDSCCDDTELCENFKKNSGQRVITCVIYLTDDFDGGETNFPNLNLKAKPSKGSAIIFHPMTNDEKKCHPKALHAGMPVISGVKIIANVWIREFEMESVINV